MDQQEKVDGQAGPVAQPAGTGLDQQESPDALPMFIIVAFVAVVAVLVVVVLGTTLS